MLVYTAIIKVITQSIFCTAQIHALCLRDIALGIMNIAITIAQVELSKYMYVLALCHFLSACGSNLTGLPRMKV